MADVITLNEIDEIKKMLESNGVNTDTNVTTLLERIGSTADTGGFATAGTAMAKLNSLLIKNSVHGSMSYTTAGTYTWICPDGVETVYIHGCGGGGGGGGGSSSAYFSVIYNVVPGTSYTIVCGAAGKAGSTPSSAATGGSGGAGGQSKFGDVIFYGGNGGSGGSYGKPDNSQTYGFAGTGGSGGSSNLNITPFAVMFVNPSVAGSSGKDGQAGAEATYGVQGFGGAGGKTALGANGGSGGDGRSAGFAGGAGKIYISW